MNRSLLLACALLAALTGCSADDPLNPSFPITLQESRDALRAMRDDPKPLERPVVVSDGYMSPGFNAQSIATRVRKATGDDRVVQAVYFSTATFDTSRDRLINKLEERFPSGDPNWTVEVDVIGVSMGGLVARYAAMPRDDGGKRLRVRRLFTLATPHTGADDAVLWPFDARVRDMRAGSDFLAMLDEALPVAEYEMVCYVRLGDGIVGEDNTAPAGQTAYWVANKPLEGAHRNVAGDERLMADILRRLRGEQSFAVAAPAPLPWLASATDAEPGAPVPKPAGLTTAD